MFCLCHVSFWKSGFVRLNPIKQDGYHLALDSLIFVVAFFMQRTCCIEGLGFVRKISKCKAWKKKWSFFWWDFNRFFLVSKRFLRVSLVYRCFSKWCDGFLHPVFVVMYEKGGGTYSKPWNLHPENSRMSSPWKLVQVVQMKFPFGVLSLFRWLSLILRG